MIHQELKDGADWFYNKFYRFNTIVLSIVNALFVLGSAQAFLSWTLDIAYQYEKFREKIVSKYPAKKSGRGKKFK